MKNEPISRIMTPSPASLPPTASAADAEELMRQHRCHHVPIVDDGRVVGMLSARDLIKAVVLQPDAVREAGLAASLERCKVTAIMRREPVVLPQTATFLDAIRALATGAMHALPVVAPDNVLAGIVTSTDLIDALLDAVEHPVGVREEAAPAGQGVSPVQLQRLRDVYRAAVDYLQSGRGEREHSRLVQAVERAGEVLTNRRIHI